MGLGVGEVTDRVSAEEVAAVRVCWSVCVLKWIYVC